MQIPGVVTGHYLSVGDGSNFGHSNKGVLKCWLSKGCEEKQEEKRREIPACSPLFSSSHCLLTLAWNRLSYGEVGWT